jgi:uncharacterized protein (DUF1501 family)
MGVVTISIGAPYLFTLAAKATEMGGTPRKRILVVVQLSGGNDGLNTVVPYGNGTYYQVRPKLAIPPNQVLPISNQIGFHPGMTGMAQLYKEGKLGIILGVGYPNPNRSHFRSTEIWQTGEPTRIVNTGWLGRYLDLAHMSDKSDNPLPAVNVDAILPVTLSASRVIVPSVANVNDFRFTADPHYRQDRNAQLTAIKKMYAEYPLNRPGADILKKVGMDAISASDYLFQVVQKYKGTTQYPDSGFARGMKFIAQMITAGVNSQIYNINFSGFDTHAAQLRLHADLLRQLSGGLAAFQKDLEEHGVDKDVLVMTFSDFGRRVAENGSQGTDHGTAEPMFVLGNAVKGGVYGEYPSLTNLDAGDLKYQIDFRSVYSTILDRWLDADSREILGGQFENVQFLQNC